jgi:hypothetical protein
MAKVDKKTTVSRSFFLLSAAHLDLDADPRSHLLFGSLACMLRIGFRTVLKRFDSHLPFIIEHGKMFDGVLCPCRLLGESLESMLCPCCLIDIVKGLWVVCEESVWIKFSSMMAGTYSGWSENTRHTSIKNERIRVLASVFPQSIICRSQSQQVGESHRRQFLADCITAIRVRLI